jgi:hypothetical protein
LLTPVPPLCVQSTSLWSVLLTAAFSSSFIEQAPRVHNAPPSWKSATWEWRERRPGSLLEPPCMAFTCTCTTMRSVPAVPRARVLDLASKAPALYCSKRARAGTLRCALPCEGASVPCCPVGGPACHRAALKGELAVPEPPCKETSLVFGCPERGSEKGT